MNDEQLKNIIEGALLAVGQALTVDRIMSMFPDEEQPGRQKIKDALKQIEDECENRGIELKQVASGYRFQVKKDYTDWVHRLWDERPSRYSRASMETLALIAYRQPITRAEIEEVRGVSVSSNIIKTLLEREWIRCVGHRDVIGKPALYGTTKQFLDYFNLKSLDELPKLSDLVDLDKIGNQFELEIDEKEKAGLEASELDEEIADSIDLDDDDDEDDDDYDEDDDDDEDDDYDDDDSDDINMIDEEDVVEEEEELLHTAEVVPFTSKQ